MEKLVEGKIYIINGKQWRLHGKFKLNDFCDKCHKPRLFLYEFIYPSTPYGKNWNGFQGGDDEPLRFGAECVKKVIYNE